MTSKSILSFLPPGQFFERDAHALAAEGALPVVDLAYLSRDERASLIRSLPRNLELGFTLAPDLIADELAGLRVAALVVPLDWELDEAVDLGAFLANFRGKSVWVEASSLPSAAKAEQAGATGIILKGFESGGVTGEESAFILLQRYEGKLPVLVRGGIGPDTAAACVAAGAAGVVLDVQTWGALALDTEVRQALHSLQGTDSVYLRLTDRHVLRVTGKMGAKAMRELRAAEEQVLVAAAGEKTPESERARTERAEALYRELQKISVSAFRPGTGKVFPVGQEAGWAKLYSEKFGSAAGIVRAVRETMESSPRAALQDFPWRENSDFAKSVGSRYPIFQGPMAQTSDVPAFAEKLMEEGCVANIALGNMPGDVCKKLLEETSVLAKGRPFGGGIIGLEANAFFRDQHIAHLKNIRPPLAVVAAGTTEQALDLAHAGVRSFLHTPVHTLLVSAMDQGHTDFILEGTEAGGHIGKLTSFVLWQSVVQALVDRPASSGLKAFVVLAGGFGNVKGAVAAAALCVRAKKAGHAFGIQMGTAFLFTKEAVETGAASSTFQQVVIDLDRTETIGDTVMTPARMAPTAKLFNIREQEYLRLKKGDSLENRKHAYEGDNLGGLRAAAKAQRIEKKPEGGIRFVQISREQQYEQGLFHVGMCAALRRSQTTIAEVVADNTARAEALLRRNLETAPSIQAPALIQEPASVSIPANGHSEADTAIAIVGLGGLFPDAQDISSYWKNIVSGKYSIREVPESRWSTKLYYSSDRAAPDKSYSKIGGFLEEPEFDSKSFKIPPTVAVTMDSVQKVTLLAVREALRDAGYYQAKEFDKTRCAVILGNSMGGEVSHKYSYRLALPRIIEQLEKTPGWQKLPSEERKQILDQVARDYLSQLPEITGGSMPGELANVISGRVASVFDLSGPNYVCDAACAASMAALQTAVRGLLAGDFDMAVTGGVDRGMDADSYIKFCKVGALSSEMSCPFDQRASGFVMGEGVGILILKRLADAERDGDKVYAVLRGMGSSSDGAGRGITAPSPTGQRKAIERAYKMAGVEPSTVTLVECHGTSTPLGDATETSVLRDWMNEHGAKPHSIAVGSVKSQIGHLKAAAGAAGLIKTVLALHNKTLPPTINFESPASGTGLGEGSPLYANTTARPWSLPEGTPRRAAVSAFGFGGTNFHALLEEFGAAGRSSKGFKGSNGGGNGVHYAAAVAATPASAPVIQAQAIPAVSVDTSAIEKKVIATLAEQTGYDPADLGRTLDLEADLGIDTVKQAEVFALLRESFQLEKDPNLKLRDYPTIEKIVGYLAGRLSGSVPVSAPVVQAAAPQAPAPVVEAAKLAAPVVDRGEIEKKIIATLAEQTGYDAADLGRTLDLEADLGIDTVKQAEVFAILRESFKLEKDPNLKLRDYPTIEKIADYLAMRLSNGTAPAAAASSAQTAATKVEAKPVVTDGPGYVAVRGKDAQDLAANLAVWAASPSGHSFGSGSKIAAFGFLTKTEGAKKAQAAAEAIRAGKKPAPPLNVRLTEARKNRAKVAFVYPGQGSQYVGMLQELMAFPEVRETFEEAERIVSPLIGKSLLSIIHPTDKSPENLARCEEELRQTEITQPAVLAADVAIHRFLVARGFSPDAVAGHSLGEYGACVAAGVLTFAQALEAVAARGREMANVQVPDKGLMLSVPLGAQDVEPLLKDIPGYIAVANRNSPGQTVIGGETAAVQELKRRLEEKGVEGILLNVSHAFHSKIVAPASAPLRKVLERLAPKAPALPLYSNVTAEPYPTGSGANAQIVDLLSKQIAASVDWIGTCQNFNRDGFEVFVECGPKRALAGLVESNLKGRPCAALQTCHPKRGELLSFMEALAHLSAETAVEDVSVRPAPAALANAVPGAVPTGILSKWASDARFPAFWAKHGGAIEGLVSHLWNLEAGNAPVVRMEARPVAQVLNPNALWAAATPVLRRVPSYKKSEIAEGRFLSGKSVAVLSLGGPAGLAQELASRGARTGASLKDADVIVVDARAMENSPDLSVAISQKLEALVEIAKSSREDAAIVGLGSSGGSFAAELLGVSVRGFLLSLSHERPQMRLRWIDAAADFADLAKAIDAECALDGLVVQGRWTKAGREVFGVSSAEVPAGQGLSPRADRVWLVTGGARGITREIVLDLAKNLGGKFALVGSSPEPTGTVQLLDETSLRKEIRAEAKSRGAAIAAGEVEAEVRRRLAAADIQKALEALRAAGCEGRYYACDLSDEKSVGNLLSRVRKDFGALNVVIHGAGREMSHATAEKTGKEIRETLAPKLGGALALARGTKGDSLEAFVLFGSVVGRLGNRGQADYAAANLSLSVLASRFAEIGNASAKALLLDWSAWADVGMASRGVAKQFFKEAGVDVIHPATGAPLVRAELLAGASGEILVCGSLGDLDRAGVLARVEQVASSGATAVTVEAEPWLVDHSISGVPILPGVAGIELLRRAAGFSGKAFEARGVRFNRAIKVFAGKGAALRASAGAVECEVQTPQGKEFKTHFTAQGFSSLGEQAGSLNREIPGADARTRTGIYKAYFHGPLFQVMTGGLDARSSEWFFTAKAADFFKNGKLLSGAGADASAIEAAFQAAGLRLLIEHGESALPSGIAKLCVFRKVRDGENLTIAVAPLFKEGNWRSDVRVYGEDGAEAVRLTGYEQVVTGQNVSLPEELRGGGKSAPVPAAAQKAPVAASPVNVDRGEVLGRILEVLCRETGYEASDINPDSDLEADLGIDTVKQAEVFAHVRTSYNLEKDQNFKLRDYPTLNRLADYVVMRLSGATTPAAPAPEERKVETAEEKLLKADHIGLPSPPLGEGWARFAAVNALDVQARLDRDPAGVLGILSPEERAEYQAFEYQKRKDEWLAGRLASRQALKAFGIDTPVHVTHDESGEPKFVGDLGERFGLTISHSHIWACAVVFERTGPIGEQRVLGLDVERIEQRPAAFLEDHFTDEERRWVTSGGTDAPFRATVLWSLKESALKALGTGLRLRPADVAVQVLGANGHGEARVQLLGEAQARQRSLGLAEFEGRYTRDAEFVVTVVETARVPALSSETIRRGSGWTIGFRPAGKTQAD